MKRVVRKSTVLKQYSYFILENDAAQPWLSEGSYAFTFFHFDSVEVLHHEVDHQFPYFKPFLQDLDSQFKQALQSESVIYLHKNLGDYQDTHLFMLIFVPLFNDAGQLAKVKLLGFLSENENLFNEHIAKFFFEQSNDAIFISNREGIILHVNPAFTGLIGYTADDVVGKTSHFLNADMEKEDTYQQVRTTAMEEGSWKGFLWNKTKSGKLFLHYVKVNSLRGIDRQNEFFINTFTDITEEQKMRRDLKLASSIQKEILPTDLKNHLLQINSYFLSQNNLISGDFYWYEWEQEKEILVGYLIDLMGHGVATA